MKKFKIKDTNALYVKRVDRAISCDFCEEIDVEVIELEDSEESQICKSCIEELYKVANKLLRTTPSSKV